MSDFLNPLGGRFLGPTGLSGPNVISATIPDPPQAFARLDPGTILKGIVIGREADGLTAIATDKGTVKVATNIALPVGAHVTMEVRSAGDRLQALILSVEGGTRQHPPSAASQSVNTGATQTGAASTADATADPASSNSGADASARAQAPRSAEPTGIQVAGSILRATVVHPFTDPLEMISSGTITGLKAGLGTSSVPGTVASAIATPASLTMPKAQAPGSAAIRSHQGETPAALATAQAKLLAVIASIDTAIEGTMEGVVKTEATQHSAPIVSPPPGAAPTSDTPASLSPLVARPASATPTLVPLAGMTHGNQPETIAGHIPVRSALSAQPHELGARIAVLFAESLAAGLPAAARAATGSMVSDKSAGRTDFPAAVGATQEAIPLPLGAELKLHLLAVQASPAEPIEFDSQAGASTKIVIGRVIALTPAGHAVIRTPVGEIMLEKKSSLPIGAQVALSIDAVEAPLTVQLPSAPQPVQSPQQALLSLSRGWPTLADFLSILLKGTVRTQDEQAFAQRETIRQALGAIPQVGPRLGAGIMATLAAMRSGEIDRLLGPLFRLKGLGASQERDELTRRLRAEFPQLAALAQDRPDIDWRALFLPVLDERGRLAQINLFYRRSRQEEAGDDRAGTGTRFVVEADFSRMGPFQLDGLVRKKRFELMVRSRLRLPDRVRRDIEAIYEEARGITGFAGSIAFQTVSQFPVAPLEEIRLAGPRTSA